MIEKTDKIINLFDFYQNLLTEKQQNYIKSYYEDDLSLSEVAEKFEVSRNAVHDNLKRVESMLNDYEDKLKLLEKHKKKIELLGELRKVISEEYEGILFDLEEL
ncbi:putative DNA-binding protein [Mycoplasmatota bacterium]|nr:putative DNA-binding protein [Mycoplasmatota bacterium]